MDVPLAQRPGPRVEVRGLAAPGAGVRHVYRLAGGRLGVDAPLAELEPFRLPADAATAGRAVEPPDLTRRRPVYSGVNPLAEVERVMESWRLERGYLLRIEAAGEFWLRCGGRRELLVDRIGRPSSEEALTVALLGPVLIVTLALADVWLLHAAALVGGASGSAAALMGPSGSGKSTMARELGAAAGAPLERLADDLLPVLVGGGAALALPHYPQLRLRGDEQPRAARGAAPLRRIFLLDRQPGGAAPRAEPLGGAAAVAALAAATFATYLLDRDDLARHWRFCTELAGAVPIARLRYPEGRAGLEAVGELLQRALAAG